MSKTKHQIAKDFIWRSFREAYKPVWSNEIRIFNQLYKEYPDLEFWDQFEMPFKLRSLAFLKSERGREILEANYNSFAYKNREPKKIESKEVKKFGDVLISDENNAKVMPKKNIEEFIKENAKN